MADCNNSTELGNMLSKGKVVLSTTGPYSIYGTKVVEQSIESGTHYCDITGEVSGVDAEGDGMCGVEWSGVEQSGVERSETCTKP